LYCQVFVLAKTDQDFGSVNMKRNDIHQMFLELDVVESQTTRVGMVTVHFAFSRTLEMERLLWQDLLESMVMVYLNND
jgi:hypothetical protein